MFHLLSIIILIVKEKREKEVFPSNLKCPVQDRLGMLAKFMMLWQ